MRYIYAKVGTMPAQKILVIKGSVKMGSHITWVDGPYYQAKYGRKETGFIDGIKHLDGVTLYLICRF